MVLLLQQRWFNWSFLSLLYQGWGQAGLGLELAGLPEDGVYQLGVLRKYEQPYLFK